jgi:hypothetical protein
MLHVLKSPPPLKLSELRSRAAIFALWAVPQLPHSTSFYIVLPKPPPATTTPSSLETTAVPPCFCPSSMPRISDEHTPILSYLVNFSHHPGACATQVSPFSGQSAADDLAVDAAKCAPAHVARWVTALWSKLWRWLLGSAQQLSCGHRLGSLATWVATVKWAKAGPMPSLIFFFYFEFIWIDSNSSVCSKIHKKLNSTQKIIKWNSLSRSWFVLWFKNIKYNFSPRKYLFISLPWLIKYNS